MNITDIYSEENLLYVSYYANILLEDINYILVGFILFYIF
jgi:hypothetical protein